MELLLLLLTTTGYKSGKKHTVPLGFLKDGTNYIVTASNAGRDQNPDWFLNLRRNPEVTIRLQGVERKVNAEVVNPKERERLWKKLMIEAPSYQRYEKQTKRTIPMVILRPISEK
ncbi:MAG: nitroreductase family deazaflavin-dependent oxidoreductase [Candidatus Woykebacteria bacterium]